METFELTFQEQKASFKKPTIEQIEEMYNHQFLTLSITESIHKFLTELYIEGDTIFFSDEDYLNDLIETIGELMDDIIGYYDIEISDKNTIIFSDSSRITLRNTTFTHNKRLRTEKYAENFKYISKLKEFALELIDSDPIIIIEDNKKMLITALFVGANMKLDRIKLTKKYI